jgi:N-acyl-D-aspartate/D-glutamate deacylase
MSEYDLVVRGGTVIDGTGIPRYRADVAVKDGKVAKISGKIAAGGAKEIDAGGCIVAPGVIDLHTHYDAQLNWDPYCSVSGWHGVTSLTIGQCGFGFAPTKPDDRELNMRMMNRVEAIPLESMRKGMRWDWETFPEFLDSLEAHGLGLNVGALFPFSAMRGYVLGMIPARERTSVTEGELGQMKQLFHEAMKAGAFGISADKNMEDRPEDGSFLPSHVASDEEFLALADVLGEFGVGHYGWTIGVGHEPDECRRQEALLTEIMKRTGRPLHVIPGDTEGYKWVEASRAEGFPVFVQVQVVGGDAEFKLDEYNLFDFMPNWVQPFVGTREERAAKMRDPSNRAAMKTDVEKFPSSRTEWSGFKILEVAEERNYKYEGLTVQELAESTGKHPLDAFLDLALDEDLQTLFGHRVSRVNEERREQLIKYRYSHISVSDGGAHTRFRASGQWPIHFLRHWVRDKEVMTLEQAHHKMSALPAWFADFKDRGNLKVGSWADIIVYNLDELGFLHPKPVFDTDFPGGERRLIQKPTGLRYTIVNGAVTFQDNECTGALPGTLLRSYDMVG